MTTVKREDKTFTLNPTSLDAQAKEYRPISLSSFFFKVLEILGRNNRILINPTIVGKSTETVLYEVARCIEALLVVKVACGLASADYLRLISLDPFGRSSLIAQYFKVDHGL